MEQNDKVPSKNAERILGMILVANDIFMPPASLLGMVLVIMCANNFIPSKNKGIIKADLAVCVNFDALQPIAYPLKTMKAPWLTQKGYVCNQYHTQ